MRVLFATVSEKSHMYAMVPMAWALASAGHEVRIASSPGLAEAIKSTGLTAVSVGTDHNLHEMLAAARDSLEEPLADWSKPYPETHTWEEVHAKFEVSVMFAAKEFNNCIVHELVDYARHWQPDLVIWECSCVAGPVAARAVGAAHARLLWCIDIYAKMRQTFLLRQAEQPEELRDDPMANWLGAILAEYDTDFDEEVTSGQWTIDQVPTSLQIPADLDRIAMRCVPYNGPSLLPDWLREPPKKPRVVLSSGLSARVALGGTLLPVKQMVQTLGTMDIEVVAALSEEEAALIGTVPDNTRIVDFVPLHAILPSSSVLISHGGFGSWGTAIANGVPQFVTAIRWADSWNKGQVLHESGAGIAVHPSELTEDVLRTSIQKLISDDSYRKAAEQLRLENLDNPAPHQVVTELEKRTAQHRRR